MAANTPYTYLPPDVCNNFSLPDFPVKQDCTSFEQLFSEVCGVIFLPDGGVPASDWANFAEWEAIFDNTDPTTPHYMVGIGSFLPAQKSPLTLAGGRVVENRERTYRLAFTVLNMDPTHVSWARKLQANNRSFRFWLHTLGNRVIGGQMGMYPFYTDAETPFGLGDNVEQVQIVIDTEFLVSPAWV